MSLVCLYVCLNFCNISLKQEGVGDDTVENENTKLYERISRIETVQERVDNHIQELNKTTKELTQVVSELANQRESIKRLHDRQDETTMHITEMRGEMFQCNMLNKNLKEEVTAIKDKMVKYEEIEKSVTHNSFITKLVIGVASAVFLAALSVGGAIVKSGLGV